MGRYHAILFDMDGTLLDTLTDMQDAVNHVLAAHGLPLRTLEEVRRFVGNGAGPLIHRALPEGYPQEQKVLAEYRAYYQAHNCIRTCPYPGIPELLEQLRQRGLKLAVVSNKPDETTARWRPGSFRVGSTGAARRYPLQARTGDGVERHGAAGVDAQHALYVGDSEVDVEMAHRAGLPLAAVAWGFRGRALLEQAGARCIVDTVPELLAVAAE
ncbi:MAG: HAD family hydrolase [Oscillospiraceae bacterium]